jgi:hypothetical protein
VALADRDPPNLGHAVGHQTGGVPLREGDLERRPGGRCGQCRHEHREPRCEQPPAPHADILPALYPRCMAESESCWRCGATMLWIQSTWQCPRCKWKLGCCEGDPQTCTDFAPEQVAAEPAGR